jgi:hypothetical protein
LKDLNKEGIVSRIMEKEFISQFVTGQTSVPASGTDSAPAVVDVLASPSIVTILDSF